MQQREARATASQDRWLKAVTAAGSWTFLVEQESSISVVEGSGFLKFQTSYSSVFENAMKANY